MLQYFNFGSVEQLLAARSTEKKHVTFHAQFLILVNWKAKKND